MNKKFVVLGVIGVLIVVGISGCFEKNRDNNFQDIQLENLLINTNKFQYILGETIEVTIKNTYKEKVILGFLNVQILYNGNWSTISDPLGISADSMIPYYQQINASETIIQFWDGRYYETVACIALVGVECPPYIISSIYTSNNTYRLSLSYKTLNDTIQEVHSNNFTIMNLPIDTEEKAIAYAKTDSDVESFIDKESAYFNVEVIATAYYTESGDIWTVYFAPYYVKDIQYTIRFNSNGTIIDKGQYPGS